MRPHARYQLRLRRPIEKYNNEKKKKVFKCGWCYGILYYSFSDDIQLSLALVYTNTHPFTHLS